jgi:hypothetical protein
MTNNEQSLVENTGLHASQLTIKNVNWQHSVAMQKNAIYEKLIILTILKRSLENAAKIVEP